MYGRNSSSVSHGSQFENNYITEMCSASETGSYLRLIDCVYHSPLELKVIKKKRRRRITKPGPQSGPAFFICKVKAVRTLYAFPSSPRSGLREQRASFFSLSFFLALSLSLARPLSLFLSWNSAEEKVFIHFMTSDCKLKASREGSK